MSEAAQGAGVTRSDRALAAGMALVLVALYLVLRQTTYVSDGRFWLAKVEAGDWGGHSPLYAAAAQLTYAAGRALAGASPEAALHTLSAVANAVAAALVALAARTLGLGRIASFGAAALVALAPNVWFFATTVEEQSVVTLPAAAAALWYARRRAAHRLDGDALVPLLWLGATTATHVSGALLAPAAAFVAFFGTGRLRVPRRALLATALVAAGIVLAMRAGSTDLLNLLAGSVELWSLGHFQRVFVESTGALLVPIAVLVLAVLRRRAAASGPEVALVLCAALPFVAFVPGLLFDESRSYTLALYPVLGLLAAFGLSACGRAAGPVALACVLLQAGASFADQRAWRYGYEGAEWIPTLVEETGGNAIVLVAEESERNELFHHTRLFVLSPRVGNATFPLAAPETFAYATGAIERARNAGARVAILASLYGSDEPQARVFVERIVERYGEPVPGRRDEYLLFDLTGTR